jgi:hypothetical protein
MAFLSRGARGMRSPLWLAYLALFPFCRTSRLRLSTTNHDAAQLTDQEQPGGFVHAILMWRHLWHAIVVARRNRDGTGFVYFGRLCPIYRNGSSRVAQE